MVKWDLRQKKLSAEVQISKPYDGEGKGRYSRRKKSNKTNLPTHYLFSKWAYDDHGKRYAVPAFGVRKDKRPYFPLMSTVVRNCGTQTETLLYLHIDLDYNRADARWIMDDKLHWPSMAGCLQQSAPALLQHIGSAMYSSGGQGLSLAIPISPLELIPETTDIQKLAHQLQAIIIEIFNYHGMGADPGARGLKRLMPNFFQQNKVIDGGPGSWQENRAQRKRPRIIQNLLYALRFHPALRPVAKRDRDDILWPDSRLEIPLAGLFLDLLDRVGPWGSEQVSARELMTRLGVAKNSAYKILNSELEWLKVTPNAEGFRLQIVPSPALTDRAYEVLSTKPAQAKQARPSFHTLSIPPPEKVVKGERNTWLKAVVLAFKWRGTEQHEASKCIESIRERVPGWKHSRSLTAEFYRIVSSLYYHRRESFASNPGLMLPSWLEEALTSPTPYELSQIFTKKGLSFHDCSCRGVDSPAVIPEPCIERLPPVVAPSSPIRNGVRPEGSGAGQAPDQMVETEMLEVDSKLCGSASSIFSLPALRSYSRIPPPCSDPDPGNTLAPVSGSMLSSALFESVEGGIVRYVGGEEKQETLIVDESEMQRIDSQGSVNGKFQDKTPTGNGTILSAKWLNSVQEEIVNAISDSKITLAESKQNQLSEAISARIVALSSSKTEGSVQSIPSTFLTPDNEIFAGAKMQDTFSMLSYTLRFGNGMIFREFYLQPSTQGPLGTDFPDLSIANTVSIFKRNFRIVLDKSAANIVFTLGFMIAGRDRDNGRGYITPSINVRADATGNLAFSFGEVAAYGLLLSQDSATYNIILTSARASGFGA